MRKKKITLYDFLKRLVLSGLDMTGCQLCNGSGTYKFARLNGHNVQVKYGRNFEIDGTMSHGLVVESIDLATPFGRKIVESDVGRKSIIITFSDRPSRW